jgi:hypothetical protein
MYNGGRTMKRSLIFIKDISEMYAGKAHLYKVYPPAEYLLNEGNSALTDYVVASVPMLPAHEPRVYLYPADDQGRLLDWTDIMVFRGTSDIDAAVRQWAETPAQSLVAKESA